MVNLVIQMWKNTSIQRSGNSGSSSNQNAMVLVVHLLPVVEVVAWW